MNTNENGRLAYLNKYGGNLTYPSNEPKEVLSAPVSIQPIMLTAKHTGKVDVKKMLSREPEAE